MLAISVFITVLLVVCSSAPGIECKDVVNVDQTQLTDELQVQMFGSENEFGFAWWIPIEFWKTSFGNASGAEANQAIEIIDALRPYYIIAFVQADISPFGSFNFYPRDTLAANFKVQYTDSTGTTSDLHPIEIPSGDINLLIESMKPMLRAGMGDMGANVHFFVFLDRNDRGERVLDPHVKGELDIQLATRAGGVLQAVIETPLDALFIPRKCPNGKDAHVSWSFCPWTGEELAE
jgi:hypothetical protein